MSTTGVTVEIAWPEPPAGPDGVAALAGWLDAALRDRAGVTGFDEHGLAVEVYRPHEAEALAAELADRLKAIGVSRSTSLTWHDHLGEHRRSVDGRRVAARRAA